MKVLGVNVVFPLLGFYCHGAFLINVEQESELWKGAYSHIRSHKSRTTRWLLACSVHDIAGQLPALEEGWKSRFPICQRNAMPSACRFDWSQQRSHNHITRANEDRKLPKEQDCHCPICLFFSQPNFFFIYFIWCHLSVPPNHCLATLYLCVTAHRRAPSLKPSDQRVSLPLKPRQPSKTQILAAF